MKPTFLWRALALFLLAGTAQAIPLDTLGTFCGLFPGQCRNGTEALMAVRGSGTNAYYVLEVDPTTGALPVNVTGGTIIANNASVGPTGSAVPADITYVGLNNGGNAIGAVGDSSGRQIVVGAGVAGTPAGGLMTIQGAASMTAVKVDGSGVTGPVNVTQFGSNAVVTGTGASGVGIPRVTVSNDSTVGLVAGSAIVGKVGIDQTTPGTTNAVSATNFPTTVDVNVGQAGASTIRVSQGGYPYTSAVVALNDYSSTNVGTGAYVQLIASTVTQTNTVCISSSNAAPIKMAVGSAISPDDVIYLPGGGSGCYGMNIPAGSRISIESLSGTASTGFFLYTGY